MKKDSEKSIENLLDISFGFDEMFLLNLFYDFITVNFTKNDRPIMLNFTLEHSPIIYNKKDTEIVFDMLSFNDFLIFQFNSLNAKLMINTLKKNQIIKKEVKTSNIDKIRKRCNNLSRDIKKCNIVVTFYGIDKLLISENMMTNKMINIQYNKRDSLLDLVNEKYDLLFLYESLPKNNVFAKKFINKKYQVNNLIEFDETNLETLLNNELPRQISEIGRRWRF